MKYSLLLAALLASFAAHATGDGPKLSTTGTFNVNPHATAESSNTNSVRQNQAQVQTQASTNSSSTGASSSSNSVSSPVTTTESNNASQSVATHTPRQVASAAGVTVMPTSVCSGVTGAGAQGASFGLSFGTSWTDKNCELLEQARTVAVVLADTATAEEILCGIESYREARIRTGRPCAGTIELAFRSGGPIEAYQHTDPIIRRRLGLPPL